MCYNGKAPLVNGLKESLTDKRKFLKRLIDINLVFKFKKSYLCKAMELKESINLFKASRELISNKIN